MRSKRLIVMYIAYYHMVGLSPDLPVQVTADNFTQAVEMFAKWRNKKEELGYGHLLDSEPFKVELDEFDPFQS
jgi:hypothetical protein